MKILHDEKTGRIFARIKDTAWADFAYYDTRTDENGKYWMIMKDGSDNVQLPLTLLDLPEDETNKDLCREILRVREKNDDTGAQKYSVSNNNVVAKAGWEEIDS